MTQIEELNTKLKCFQMLESSSSYLFSYKGNNLSYSSNNFRMITCQLILIILLPGRTVTCLQNLI